jgi:hypothetical protein
MLKHHIPGIIMKSLLHLFVLFLFTFPASFPVMQAQQQPIYVGIPSNQMNYYASAQNNSQWCWAASIQMVLNYYGVSINQEQIVARTYGTDYAGNLPNWAGSLDAIHNNLNNWSMDNYGYSYTVSASMGRGAPTPAILVQELSAGRPIIIGYQTGQGGHAVVITAVSYIPTMNGPYIQSIVVRDPWPSQQNMASRGRVEYGGVDLANRIDAHWYVRVYR